MTFMQMKTATLLIGEHGFDAESFLVPVQRFAGWVDVGE